MGKYYELVVKDKKTKEVVKKIAFDTEEEAQEYKDKKEKEGYQVELKK